MRQYPHDSYLPQLPPICILGVAIACVLIGFSHAFYNSLHYLPFWDDYGSLFEPIEKYGTHYFAGASSRLFFRPLEYFLNYFCQQNTTLWLVPFCSVILTAAGAFIISLVFVPADSAQYLVRRAVVAAFAFLHPLVLPSNFQFDTVSQASANLFATAALWAVTRRTISITLLLLIHLGGLASKESYFSFLLATSAVAAITVWRQENRPRAITTVLIVASFAAAYFYLRAQATNLELLATTERYHLRLGTNVVSNTALFSLGTAYLGDSALAAQGLGLSVLLQCLATALFWIVTLVLVFKRKAFLSADEAKRSNPPWIAAAIGIPAALIPSVMANDVSEQNVSGFSMLAIAFIAAHLLSICFQKETAISPDTRATPLVALKAICIALISCTAGQMQKLSELRHTSDENQRIASQALAHRGSGIIVVNCEPPPKRSYSVYFMPSSVLAGHLESMLRTKGKLLLDDQIRCAPLPK